MDTSGLRRNFGSNTGELWFRDVPTMTLQPGNKKLCDTSSGRSMEERFLFVLPWELDHIGGVNQVVKNLAHQFLDCGTAGAVFMSSQFGHDQIYDRKFNNGLRCYRLTLMDPQSRDRKFRTLMSFIFRIPLTAYKFYRLLVAERITTVNFHYPLLSSLPAVLATKYSIYKAKVIFSFHGSDIARIQKSGRIWRMLWTLMIGRVDIVVVCSKALSHEFHKTFPRFSGKLSVIHNGVDLEQLQQLAAKNSIPPELAGKRFVLNAATLEYKKGQDILVRSFGILANRFPNLFLVIFGRPAEAKPALYKLIETQGLQARVMVFEDMPHGVVIATMKEAALFVLPSRVEPFGIVLLEAGTFRVPVIATRTGGVVEIIRDGVNGLLVTTEDVDALANRMANVLDGSIDIAAITSNFYDQLKSRFTWKRAATEYLQL